jgi:hypothetical protein
MTLQHHALNPSHNSCDTLWGINQYCRDKQTDHEECHGRWTWPGSNLQICCFCRCHDHVELDKKRMYAKIVNRVQQHDNRQPARTSHLDSHIAKKLAVTIDGVRDVTPSTTRTNLSTPAPPTKARVILGLSGHPILSAFEYNFARRYDRPFDKQDYMRKYLLAKKSKSRWWE